MGKKLKKREFEQNFRKLERTLIIGKNFNKNKFKKNEGENQKQ